MKIEKRVELKAPISRVWRALTDPTEFGEWFRVKFETGFEVGKEARGRVLHPGYEHVVWRATIRTIDAERHVFALSWHPYAIDSEVDYAGEAPTLVEFRLAPAPDGGTVLTLTESGFEKLPAGPRRLDAFRMNDGGWTEQMKNIRAHVGG